MTAACPLAIRCADRRLCPPACQEAGSRENRGQRPPLHPADLTPAAPPPDAGEVGAGAS